MDGLRNELKPWGIKVISVLPGHIKTNFESKWSERYMDRPDLDSDIVSVYKTALNKYV